jgi:hypothetical protein
MIYIFSAKKQWVLHVFLCVCVCAHARARACANERVALLIQHKKLINCIVLLFVVFLAPPHFSDYLINGTSFVTKYLT